MAIQQLLIRLLLEPLSRITGGLRDKTKDNLFLLFGTGIVLYAFLYHMQVIQWRYLYSFAMCCVLLGLMILVTLPKKLEPVKFRPFFSVCWFGVGGLMLLSALRNNFNYLPESLLFLVAYPIIYISWGNGDTIHRFRTLLKLAKITCVIFFVLSFLFIKITTRRYGGIFYNVNNCGSYLALASACILLELLYEPESTKRNVFNILLYGMCYGMVTLTNSRSGKLALLAAAFVGVVMYLLSNDRKNKKKVFLNLAGCFLASMVMVSCLLYVFQLRQYLPLPYYNQKTQSFYMTENWIKFFEQKKQPTLRPVKPAPGSNNSDGALVVGPDAIPFEPDEGYVESTTEPTDPVEFFDAESFQQFGDNKTSTDGKTADQITSGRLSIWKGYVKRLKWLGVPQKETLYLEDYKVEIHTTHMTILEIAYESGIFAGVLYLLVNLTSGLLAIAYAWKNRENKFAAMPLMVILAFGIVSVLGSFNSSFNYVLTLYYYLLLFPLITKGRKTA